MIRKKIYFLSILLILSSCGFDPLYSNKNINYTISKINYENTKLNNKIVRALKSLTSGDNLKKISIDLDTQKQKRVKSKNSKGDPIIYELSIQLNIKTNNFDKNLIQSITYNNNADKFQLNLYEKELEETLINRLIEDTLQFLTIINDS